MYKAILQYNESLRATFKAGIPVEPRLHVVFECRQHAYMQGIQIYYIVYDAYTRTIEAKGFAKVNETNLSVANLFKRLCKMSKAARDNHQPLQKLAGFDSLQQYIISNS